MGDHTPGPWMFDGEYVWAERIKSYVADPEIEGLAEEIIEANARLIAAAPDLLVALEEIAEIADDWPRVEDLARAAIAKARQGSETPAP